MPEYNHAAYSKNVTPILNNGICGVDIFKIMPLFKICDTYAAMLYSVPFRLVCREGKTMTMIKTASEKSRELH